MSNRREWREATMSILTAEGTCDHFHHILFPTQIHLMLRRRLHMPVEKQGSLGAILEADSLPTNLLLHLRSSYY